MAETLISCLIADLPRLMPAKLVEESQELLELLKKVRSVLPGVLANSIKNEDWLTKLDDAVWEADKIVDEFRYAELLTEAKASGYQQNDDNVKAGIFSHFNINNNLKLPFLKIGRGGVQLDGYKSKIGSVINKFDAIVSRMGSIRVNQNEATIIAAAQKPQEKIFQNPTDIGALIVGLDEKRDKIVEYLLDPSNIICETIVTVSISGESGTGIILAQSICNDARIINYFDCIIWVDLGIQPNAAKIAKNIIDQAIGKDCYLSEDDPDLLQHRLYQELSGKRYLLVWNIKWVRDNEINKVLNKLKLWVERCGGKGNSQIVVCTNKIHHEKPGLPNYACDLKTLEDDMSMLFAKTAFYNGQGTPQKKLQVAKEIVRGCGKSMQLVNMMGNLMRFKKHRAEWDEIINYIKLGGKPDSQKLVNLCLLNLSSETKQCLQFCCIFPKGYYMDKEVLIELWMANGLFTSDEPTLLEQKGNSIFNELVFRNLLEDVKRVPGDKYGNKHEYGSRVVCKMAEILHNLASVPECCNNNAHKNIGPFKKLYCYLSIPNDSPEDIPRLLQEYPHARTLVFLDEPFVRTVNYSVLPENCLRALHLRSAVFDKDRFK